MAAIPNLQQSAQLISIAGSLLAAGYNLSFSQNTVPQLYALPAQTSTPIFTRVFHAGSLFIIPCAVSSSLASAWLAYRQSALQTSFGQRQGLLWAAAGLTTFLTAPWTALVMGPGIQRLMQISTNEVLLKECARSSEHVKLLNEWVRLNAIRASLFALGGGFGLWATIVG